MADPKDEALTGVVAHGLLNSVAAITGSLSMALSPKLSDDEVRDLVSAACEHARFLGALLGDFVRGLPPDVRMALSTRD